MKPSRVYLEWKQMRDREIARDAAVREALRALMAYYTPKPPAPELTMADKILAAVNGSEVSFGFIAQRLPGHPSGSIGCALTRMVESGRLERVGPRRYRAAGHN